MNDIIANQILRALSEDAQKRTSAENVQDVLEAIGVVANCAGELHGILRNLPTTAPDAWSFVDKNLNCYVHTEVRNNRTELIIYPKTGGALGALAVDGDAGPFAG